MEPSFGIKICFICCQEPKNCQITPDSEEDLRTATTKIICQHFWFQEDDLQGALICGNCWDKVDEFHQFYQNVKTLHDQLKFDPVPLVTIKQEEIDIEEERIQDEDVEVKCEIPAIKVESLDDGYENTNEDLPLRKEPQDIPLSRRSAAKLQRTLKANKRKAQDEVIQQHLRYRCEECNLDFDSFCTAIQHRFKEHKQASITCCDRQFKTREMLYRHVLNPGTFKCEICSGTFKLLSGYMRHKRKHHAGDKSEQETLLFQCHRCTESFPEEVLLKRHLIEHQASNCDLCGRNFRTRNHLQKHTKAVHQAPTDYICTICSKGFYRRSLFVEHQKTHELTADQLKEQCQLCHRWLKNHSTWERHMKRHRFEGQFKCEDCDHISVNLLALKDHRKRIHGPIKREHLCELCGKGYTRALFLTEHVANAHTGVPLYECKYCSKNFFSNATMYAHRKKDHKQEWQRDQELKYANKEEEACDESQ